LPFTLGCRPSPPSITPAFTSSSLYLPIATNSSSLGITPASLFLVALTITMTFIVVSFRRGAGCACWPFRIGDE
jgi:hypothetical protein